MKRIGIIYSGTQFSVGELDYDALKSQIDAAQRDGRSAWLAVNHGEGRPQRAELLIGPGIPIALLPIPADSDDATGADGPDGSRPARDE